MKKVKIKSLISPLFILLCLLLLYFGNIKYFLIYALVVSLHEFAHYFVSKKLGYKLNKLYIMPYGICLNYKDNAFSGSDEIYIALSGPLFNFLLCFICVALWWLFPETYYYLDYFCFCNLVLGAFNLFPCFPLDGGRILLGLLSKKMDREKAYKISVVLNYAISLMLIIAFIVSIFSSINYSYILVAIFLFSGCLNPSKLSSYNYLSLGVTKQRLLKNGANIKIIAVESNMPIYKIISKFSKYKFNIVYVVFSNGTVKILSEININNLAIKYSPAFSLNEITLLKK